MLTVDLTPTLPAATDVAELTALRAVWDAIRPLTATHRLFPDDRDAVARWAGVTAALSRCRYLAAHDAGHAALVRAHDRLEAALARAPRFPSAGSGHGAHRAEQLWNALADARTQLAAIRNGGPAVS